MEGLEKILRIGGNSPMDSRCREKLDALVDAYQLKEHLGERSYVFESVDKSLKRAKNITSGLKVFARSPQKEETKKENLLELIRSAIQLIPQKYRSDTDIQIEIDPAQELSVNRIEIIQLFLNLIQNALEAMEGKGKLLITMKTDGGFVDVEIADQGRGITPENADRVFNPFFTTKTDGQHMGLGLSIALEIAEKYGGEIRLKSSSGKGTTQKIRLKKS